MPHCLRILVSTFFHTSLKVPSHSDGAIRGSVDHVEAKLDAKKPLACTGGMRERKVQSSQAAGDVEMRAW